MVDITGQNLDLPKVGVQIVSGVVENARKWVSGGVIKFTKVVKRWAQKL